MEETATETEKLPSEDKCPICGSELQKGFCSNCNLCVACG